MPECNHEWNWFEAQGATAPKRQARRCRHCDAHEEHAVCRSGIRCVSCTEGDKGCACDCHKPAPKPAVKTHASVFSGPE